MVFFSELHPREDSVASRSVTRSLGGNAGTFLHAFIQHPCSTEGLESAAILLASDYTATFRRHGTGALALL